MAKGTSFRVLGDGNESPQDMILKARALAVLGALGEPAIEIGRVVVGLTLLS